MYLGDSRTMSELADGAIDLAVTSPPYWHIKDYGEATQIGYGQSLHEYLRDLYVVWKECHRVIRDGGRLCVNVGDQFARATVYGRYRVIPLHAEVIRQCETVGFDFLGSIIWQKKTTVNTTGGAPIMGSFPYPPNGIVELDYEHILLFKKPGPPKKVSEETRAASRLSKEEWKALFSGHWSFGGARKTGGHEAPFPEELPRRLTRMFSFAGDTVLDPFAGTGTTLKVGLELGRNVVGYEISAQFAELAASRIRDGGYGVELRPCPVRAAEPHETSRYAPGLCDARPLVDPEEGVPELDLKTVDSVTEDCALALSGGPVVHLRGISIHPSPEARDYLEKRVVKKKVFLRNGEPLADGSVSAYVYLKNRIFVNAHMLKAGMAVPDGTAHRLAARFRALSGPPPLEGRRT